MTIPGMEAKVLFLNIGEDKLGRITMLCERYGAIPVAVAPSDQNREMGELAG